LQNEACDSVAAVQPHIGFTPTPVLRIIGIRSQAVNPEPLKGYNLLDQRAFAQVSVPMIIIANALVLQVV